MWYLAYVGASSSPVPFYVNGTAGNYASESGDTIDVSSFGVQSGDIFIFSATTGRNGVDANEYYPIPSGFAYLLNTVVEETIDTMATMSYKFSDGTETTISIPADTGPTATSNETQWTIAVVRNVEMISGGVQLVTSGNTGDPPSISVTPSIEQSIVLVSGFSGIGSSGSNGFIDDGNGHCDGVIPSIADLAVGFGSSTGTGWVEGWLSGTVTIDLTGPTLGAADSSYGAATMAIVMIPFSVFPGDRLVMSGDSVGDQISLSGDMNGGSDVLLPSTTYGA